MKCIRHKASQIKGEIDEEEYDRYARYLDALRKVLAEGVTPENFRERLLLELDPQVNEKRKRFCEILGGKLSEEEREAIKQDYLELMSDLARVTNAEAFIGTVLERNAIQIGEPVGSRLDDPLLRVFADEEEGEEEYPDEYMLLVFLGKLISDLTEPSSGKIDMASFSERCELHMENNGNLLEINGIRAAEELARSLEKNGIIKRKGDSIKWKR